MAVSELIMPTPTAPPTAQRAQSRQVKLRATTVSISEVAEHFQVTRRAIRHYETHGLLCSTRDGRNGRMFDADSRLRLQAILRLRSIGVPIREIAIALQSGRDLDLIVQEGFEARLAALEEERARIESTLRSLGPRRERRGATSFTGRTVRAPPSAGLAEAVDSLAQTAG
uniref:Transcriptional regulator, MerR family n=1 Tax=Caulobacter sp. (strain K31) TaxID=366602 RepID=B0T5J0_CAUSK